MLIAAFILFALMFVCWMVAPDGTRSGVATVGSTSATEPSMLPAAS